MPSGKKVSAYSSRNFVSRRNTTYGMMPKAAMSIRAKVPESPSKAIPYHRDSGDRQKVNADYGHQYRDGDVNPESKPRSIMRSHSSDKILLGITEQKANSRTHSPDG